MKGKKIRGVLVFALLALLASCGQITESSGPDASSETEGSSQLASSETTEASSDSSSIDVSVPDSEVSQSSEVKIYGITVVGDHVTATGPTEAEAGDEVTIELTADADYLITGATLNGEAIAVDEGTITFTMPEGEATIVVTTAGIHDIVIDAPDTVTVTGKTTGIAGEVIDLTVEVDEGYVIDAITVDGEAAELTGTTLTVTMGEGDITIVITVSPEGMSEGEGGIVEEW